MANISASMATQSSDLDDQKSGAIIHMEGHTSHHQVAKMALKRQRHLVVPHHAHHPSLWQGG